MNLIGLAIWKIGFHAYQMLLAFPASILSRSFTMPPIVFPSALYPISKFLLSILREFPSSHPSVFFVRSSVVWAWLTATPVGMPLSQAENNASIQCLLSCVPLPFAPIRAARQRLARALPRSRGSCENLEHWPGATLLYAPNESHHV